MISRTHRGRLYTYINILLALEVRQGTRHPDIKNSSASTFHYSKLTISRHLQLSHSIILLFSLDLA